MRLDRLLLTVICSSVLIACGGGGDEPPAAVSGADAPAGATPAESSTPVTGADAADKYVGIWATCIPVQQNSIHWTVENRKTSATSVDYDLNISVHVGSSSCEGPANPANTYSEQGSVVYQGTKIVGGDTVDKGEGHVTSNSDNDPPSIEKNISLVSGNTMFFGDDTSLPDADGYPTAIDRSFFLTKQ